MVGQCVMASLLFVCCNNKGRSVVCEYLVRDMLQKENEGLSSQVEVSSAGLVTRWDVQWLKDFGFQSWPKPAFGRAPYTNLIPVMSRRGIDISDHRSRGLNRLLVKIADLVITAEENQKKTIVSFWPWASGKVFAFREFVEAKVEGEFLISEDPYAPPHADGDSIDFSSDFHEAYVAEIERYLVQNIDKLLRYLQAGSSTRGIGERSEAE